MAAPRQQRQLLRKVSSAIDAGDDLPDGMASRFPEPDGPITATRNLPTTTTPSNKAAEKRPPICCCPAAVCCSLLKISLVNFGASQNVMHDLHNLMRTMHWIFYIIFTYDGYQSRAIRADRKKYFPKSSKGLAEWRMTAHPL